MATQKNALAICDECGFVYPHRVMRLNSYGMLVCPQDFEGQYDLKNHPQNRVANVKDDPAILNPRTTKRYASKRFIGLLYQMIR